MSTLLALCRPSLQAGATLGNGQEQQSCLLTVRLHLRLFRLFGRDFGLFPGEGPKTPKLANLASPQLRK